MFIILNLFLFYINAVAQLKNNIYLLKKNAFIKKNYIYLLKNYIYDLVSKDSKTRQYKNIYQNTFLQLC